MSAQPNVIAITIRPAVPADAERIARPYMESAEYHARLDPERFALPAPEAVLTRYRQPQHAPFMPGQRITLVAESACDVVGFVDARLFESPDPMHRAMTYVHIEEIAVSESHQGQGIGARLLEAAENWGRQMGAAFASLEYLAANARAATFYRERMGYKVASLTAIKRL